MIWMRMLSPDPSGATSCRLHRIPGLAKDDAFECVFRRCRTPFRNEAERDSGIAPNTFRSEPTLAS